jgi:5'-nucleotidase
MPSHKAIQPGQVLDSAYSNDDGNELRIAFDFDGVLADDESDQVFQQHGLQDFQQCEIANAVTPHSPGPLGGFACRSSLLGARLPTSEL